MIKDKLFNFPSNFGQIQQTGNFGSAPSVPNAGAPVSNGNSSFGAGDASAISAEAAEPNSASSGFNSLLQGLQSWGGDQASPQVGASQAAAGSAPAGQSRPPAEVPEAILSQVLNTLKTAGGWASVGALQSLLSWGHAEKERNGEIRPEFTDILHEAIDFAKEKKLMPEAELAQQEARLFAPEQGGEKKGKEGGDCGCKGKSLKDSLQAAATQAA